MEIITKGRLIGQAGMEMEHTIELMDRKYMVYLKTICLFILHELLLNYVIN